MALDHLSLATVPITPLFEGTTLPEATGFVWKRGDRHYLITNWHVASATNLFTKNCSGPTGAARTFFAAISSFVSVTTIAPA